ncbi:cell division protein ZipA C-terminal FtsZ-binding domain-containing protein [Chitinimonas lacunae]|uniref:Cell division protein ZipA n=1 Tax=Chitinimonas lacunae TaxID=1963018 RepID=A0ABV8MU61_9NEIS
MSEIHWITLGLAVGVVAVVWGFNLWQEYRYKKRAAAAFADNHPDVLLDAQKNVVRPTVPDRRLEPALANAPSVLGEPVPSEPEEVELSEPAAVAIGALDPAYDFIGELHLEEAVPAEQIPGFAVGKRVRVLGRAGRNWEPVTAGASYAELKVGLQLVDRQGPVNDAQLAKFCEQVNGFAHAHNGLASFPRREDKLAAAADLDRFAAAVDVLIGLNVVAAQQPFSLAQLGEMLDAAGMTLEEDGTFHAKSDSGKTLFTLVDSRQRPLTDIDQTPSVTLLLDLPRVAGAEHAFDRMADLAQQLALTLGGDLVDDEGRSLKPGDLAAIRKQLLQVLGMMDDRGIPAGGAAALRLFA